MSGVYLLFRHVLILDNYHNNGASNRLVAAHSDVPEFIHAHTNCTTLQEKLHECVGCFIVSFIGVSDTINCDI